jgi:TonB family protein
MLTSAFDGRPLAKLIDLGIARNLGTEVRLTATGVFLGKARYCSPEQFQAGGDTPAEVDRRGDIYSFGIMLYEVLTGVYPMEGNNFAELAGAHLFNPPKDFAETDPDGRISAGLRQAVLRAVAKSPDERFATAADFAKELNKYRDPDSSLRDEFDRTVEIATTAMPRIPGPGRPGSTQERINLEFGMGKTPSGARDSTADEAVADGTVAAVTRRPLEVQVKQIEELIARGQRKRAIRALDRALADHGSAEPLAELRQAIDRLGETAEGGRKMPLAAIVAVILLLLAGALGAWWWSQRAPLAEGETVMADGGSELFVSSAPRFDPDAPGSTESEFDGEIGEPPPLEEPSDPVAETSAQSPETQPATAQSVNGAPEEGSENSASAEEDDPPPADGSAASTATPPPPAKVTQEIFELGVGVEAPVLVLLPQPQVPSEGRKLREELTVMVRVLVDENGSVLRAEIASGPSFRRKYRDAALEAAQKASFRPARRGDTFGRMWTEVRVTFQPE